MEQTAMTGYQNVLGEVEYDAVKIAYAKWDFEGEVLEIAWELARRYVEGQGEAGTKGG